MIAIDIQKRTLNQNEHLSNVNAVEIILGDKQERNYVCISCYHNNTNGKSVEGVNINLMVVHFTFNNILVISWRSVFL